MRNIHPLHAFVVSLLGWIALSQLSLGADDQSLEERAAKLQAQIARALAKQSWAEAVALGEQLIATHVELHGEEHWMVASDRFGHAGVLRMARLRPADNAKIVEAFDLKQKTQLLRAEGKIGSALRAAQQGYEILVPLIGKDCRPSLLAQQDIAWCRELLGDSDDAKTHFAQIVAQQKNALGAGHPTIAESLADLGMVEINLGNLDEADAALSEAFAIIKEHVEVESLTYEAFLGRLVILRSSQGRVAEARDLLEEIENRVKGDGLEPTHMRCIKVEATRARILFAEGRKNGGNADK